MLGGDSIATERWSLSFVKGLTFEVVHTLREETPKAHRRRTKGLRGYLWTAALSVFHGVQVLSLILQPQFGFSSFLVDAGRIVSAKHIFLGTTGTFWSAGLIVLCLLAWLPLAISVFIGQSVVKNQMPHRAVIQAARLIFTVVSQGLFVVIVHGLVSSLSCRDSHVHFVDNPAAEDCDGTPVILLKVLAGISVLPYLVVAYIGDLLHHDSDGNDANADSKTSGFGTALETLIIFFVACLSLLAHTYATLACIGCFGLFLMLLVWMSLHLPYYHNFTNILLCSFYASCAFLFLGGAVGTAVNTSDVLINVWFLCTPMVAAIACFAPRIQWGRMERELQRLRKRMHNDITRQHANMSDTTRAAARRQHITALADFASAIQYREAPLPLDKDEKDVFTSQFDVNAERFEPFSGLRAYEVELVVRLELHKSSTRRRKRRRRRCFDLQPPAPTTQVVEHAMWLYSQAMSAFAGDAADIALVKIEYARFLQVYTADVNMAMTALGEAGRERPSVEGEFQVAARHRILVKKRQAQEGGDMVQATLMAGQAPILRQAARHHKAAMQAQLKIVKFVEGKGRKKKPRYVARTVSNLIAKVSTQAAKADQLYRKLLSSRTAIPGLPSLYRRFCLDVLRDENPLLDFQIPVEDDVDMGGSDHAALAPKQTSAVVKAMGIQFLCGTIVLLLLTGVVVVVTEVFLKNMDDDLLVVERGGDVRAHTASLAHIAREFSMRYRANATPTDVMPGFHEEMVDMKQGMLTSYTTVESAEMLYEWDHFHIVTRVYSQNQTWYTQTDNLWMLLTTIMGDADHYMNNPTLPETENKHWRYIMDNAVTVAVPFLQNLVNLMVDNMQFIPVAYMYSQYIIVVLMLGMMLFLAIVVFGSALKQVQLVQLGIADVVGDLQPLVVSRMKVQIKRSLAFVATTSTEALHAMAADVDETAERGVGEVDGFTYDVDVDGGRPPESLDPVQADGDTTPTSNNDDGVGADSVADPNADRTQSTNPLAAVSLTSASPRLAGAKAVATPTSVPSPTRSGLRSSLRFRSKSVDEPNTPLMRRRKVGFSTAGAGSQQSPTAQQVDLAALALFMPEPLLVFTSDTTVVFVNEEFRRITGFESGVVGESASAVLAPPATSREVPSSHEDHRVAVSFDSIMSHINNTRAMVSMRSSTQTFRVRLACADNTAQDTMVHVSSIGGADGAQHYVATFASEHAPVDDAIHLDNSKNVEVDDDDGAAGKAEEDHPSASKQRLQFCYVYVLLAAIIVFQAAGAYFRGDRMEEMAIHAIEVANSNRLRAQTHVLAFMCREAVIGDEIVWPQAEVSSVFNQKIDIFDKIRFGLRYGDSDLGLPGSVGSDPAQDRLQFGGTTSIGDASFQGLDAVLSFFITNLRACSRAYDNQPGVGSNWTAVEADSSWSAVYANGFLHHMVAMMRESEALYLAQTQTLRFEVALSDALSAVASCVTFVCLYVFVFRPLVAKLITQAVRTEQFLLLVPADVAWNDPKLAGYFDTEAAVDSGSRTKMI